MDKPLAPDYECYRYFNYESKKGLCDPQTSTKMYNTDSMESSIVNCDRENDCVAFQQEPESYAIYSYCNYIDNGETNNLFLKGNVANPGAEIESN